jgi:hypothetical protein
MAAFFNLYPISHFGFVFAVTAAKMVNWAIEFFSQASLSVVMSLRMAFVQKCTNCH